jgi:hypothetical protein
VSTPIDLANPDPDGDEARALRPLQAAAITYRIAFGPRQAATAQPELVPSAPGLKLALSQASQSTPAKADRQDRGCRRGGRVFERNGDTAKTQPALRTQFWT